MVLYDTEYPADSVEFCPYPGRQNVFVCGTYKLLKDESDTEQNAERSRVQRRVGKCLVMQVTQEEESDNLYVLFFDVSLGFELKMIRTLLQELDMSAVLDTKWYIYLASERIVSNLDYLMAVVTGLRRMILLQLRSLKAVYAFTV